MRALRRASPVSISTRAPYSISGILAVEYRVSRYRAYSDMFFTGEGSANVQKIMIAEDALGYKIADRHHGKTGLRDIRKDDVAREWAKKAS